MKCCMWPSKNLVHENTWSESEGFGIIFFLITCVSTQSYITVRLWQVEVGGCHISWVKNAGDGRRVRNLHDEICIILVNLFDLAEIRLKK